jgi:hypothetical protein
VLLIDLRLILLMSLCALASDGAARREVRAHAEAFTWLQKAA